MLAFESARLTSDLPSLAGLHEQEGTLRERYAPMHRLLCQDDELFLESQGFKTLARQVRRDHRRCYFDYVTRLAGEVRGARRLRALAMQSREQWSFWVLVELAVLSESSLLYLCWLGLRHATGVNVAASDVQESLDFLLAAPRFRPAEM